MIGISLLMNMGPVGVSIATKITNGVSASFCNGIAATAVLACAAFSALCGFMTLQDDTFELNEFVESGPKEQLGE